MEYEVRFYFSKPKTNKIIKNIEKIESLNKKECRYEKTCQYDHPMKEMTFYSKEIDGRFRVRRSNSDNYSKCILSWKRRLPDTRKDNVNKEEEVELTIKDDEYDNLIFIIEDVLKMKLVESYERYRTIYENNEIEIAIDEYPFGVAIEIENKSNDSNPKEIVNKWTKKIGIDIKDAYRLSWDDKYSELCKEQNIIRYNHVTFDLPMPKIKD